MNLTLYGVDIWSTALVFARVGAMIMLLPGFGEPAVPGRVRLGFALTVAMAIAPGLASHAPAPANTAFGMGGQLIAEIVIGNSRIMADAGIDVSALAASADEMRREQAMDRAEVVGLNEVVKTQAGEFKGCLKTEETNPLKPNEKESKLYAPGVGLVREESLTLVRHGKVEPGK